jgi:SAM-dependent methyltransferase
VEQIKTTAYKNVQELVEKIASPANPHHKTHFKRYGRTLSVLLDQNPTKGKLLEIGTSGIYPLVLQELVPGLQVHVTDYDLTKSPKGSLTLTEGDLIRKVPTYRVDIETTPLPVGDETFDYIICGEVIEHLERDPMFMMSELNRVMKTGGTLILTTPNINSAANISKMLRGQDPYFYMQYRKAGTLDRHNYEYSLSTMGKVLKASGFSGTGWTEDSFGNSPTQDILKLSSLGYDVSQTKDNIFCVARKVGPVADRYPEPLYSD